MLNFIKKRCLKLLFFLLIAHIVSAEGSWDAVAFRDMTDKERYRFVHDFPILEMKDDTKRAELLNNMLKIVTEEKDYHTQTALFYRIYSYSFTDKLVLPKGQTPGKLMTSMLQISIEEGYEVEALVARIHLSSHAYHQKKIQDKVYYAQILNFFKELETIGFDKFRDYCIEIILFQLSSYLWDFGDLETAQKYLFVAERFAEASPRDGFYLTQIYSYLQTYWKRKGNYDKSLLYAKKILNYHQNIKLPHSEKNQYAEFWGYFMNLEIASLLIEQGKIEEGKIYADKGYNIVKFYKFPSNPKDSIGSKKTELDALMVLIPIELKLNKLDSCGKMIRQAIVIQNYLISNKVLDSSKSMKLYEYYSQYYEQRGDALMALRYARLAENIRDSLDKQNIDNNLAQIKLRHETEKYITQLKVAEKDRHLSRQQRNYLIVISVLILIIAYVAYNRLQHIHNEKEKELEIARLNLQILTQGFREKSELIEHLRQEKELQTIEENRNEYLKKLTSATILTEADWNNFKSLFEKVHPGYIKIQNEDYPNLTKAELRLLMLEKLELGTQEIADMLGVNKNTIYQTRLRLRKKTVDRFL